MTATDIHIDLDARSLGPGSVWRGCTICGGRVNGSETVVVCRTDVNFTRRRLSPDEGSLIYDRRVISDAAAV